MESRAFQAGRPEVLVEPETPTLDLGRYIAVFRRHLRLFVGVVVGALLLAILATFVMTPHYTATAQVMIDTRKHTVVDVEAVTSDLPTDDTTVVDTEVEVLRSRALTERVVAAENLDNDSEFNRTNSNSTITPQRAHELVVDNVMKALKIARIGLTYVITVEFQSKDPVKATTLANAFADQYIAQELETKADANAKASAWLGSRLDAMRGQVETAEAAVAAYKQANGLMSAEGNTLTEQDISNLTEAAATAKAAQAEQDAKLATAQAQLAHGSNGEDVGEALSSPVVQQLRAQRAEVSRRVADLSSRYGPEYPDLMKAQQQLNDIDSQIHAEILRIISGLQAEDQAARQRTASTESSLAGVRGNLAMNDAASVRLNELQRDADSARTLYQSFLDRYKQTTAQQGLQQSDAQVLSRAKTPTRPSSPNALLNVALGLVVGLGAATVVVVLTDLLATGISSSSEVEQRLGVTSIGTLPLLSSTVRVGAQTRPETYLVEKPFSAFTEAFRNLNAAIQNSLKLDGGKIVAITSALPDEGKTTATICLARALALSGAAVVVVDCDLRRRSLHRVLHVEPKVGLIEVLSGKVSLEAALLRDEASGAYFLPLAQGDLTTEDVFGSPAMSRLLETLRTQFAHIFLDTAPILPVADTRKLAPKADGVVLVAHWRKTKRNAIAAAIKQLDMAGARLLGVALTQVDVREQARSGAGEADYALNTYRNYYIQ